MAKVMTATLTDKALDWAVALCKGTLPASFDDWRQTWPHYSTNPALGIPFLEQEIDNFQKREGYFYCNRSSRVINSELHRAVWATGPSLLIAATRCYVASIKGAEIEIPDELLEGVPNQHLALGAAEQEVPVPSMAATFEQPISGYQKIFSDATGITDRSKLSAIEDVVRHDIFHSTLDWQTKEQLQIAAREAVEILQHTESDNQSPAPGAI